MSAFNRRRFLKGAGGLGLIGASGLATAMTSFQTAMAAETTGYKALVCVFFKGGLDNHDTILPVDQTSYDLYSDIRSPILNGYNNISGGSTRARDRILPLDAADEARFNGRKFGLPEELSEIHDLFTRGKAAVVGNVGPLIEPTTRQQYRDRSVRLPGRLFSHNDQQSTWMASAPEGAREGWGGRFADVMLQSGANSTPLFTAISAAGNEVFLVGRDARQYQAGSGGALTIRDLEQRNLLGSGRNNSDEIQGVLNEHFRSLGTERTNLFERDVVNATRRALDANETYNTARDGLSDFVTAFPDTRLGGQLRTVAETIAIRDALGARRQVFFVSIGGFDTHDSQPTRLPGRQREISGGVGAFYAAMEELGMENDVTLFTASDFGRTLQVNGDGSDHGWGSHHFVVGGSVNGGNIFGDLPQYALDHDQDSGRGRLIPSTSVEQYAASLGRWFGLNEDELAASLPGLSAFQTDLAFV